MTCGSPHETPKTPGTPWPRQPVKGISWFPRCAIVTAGVHRTGTYSADEKWIIMYQGSGMRFAKVEALWNLHSNHEIASQEDIDQVYFDTRKGLLRGRGIVNR
jgi:hypothetical protein